MCSKIVFRTAFLDLTQTDHFAKIAFAPILAIFKMLSFSNIRCFLERFFAHNNSNVLVPRRKGYSLCKMVSLGQKLKMPKKCEKRLYEHIRVVVCKKQLQKTPNIQKMRAF